MRGFILGIIAGILLVPLVALLYLRFGHPPVTVADPAFPAEKNIVHVPLNERIDADAPHNSPISPSETNLVAGAHIYREQCAVCHGLYGRPSPLADNMYPPVPQLWRPHGHGVVGVSDDPVGETYFKVANGIRLTGMPAFDHILSQNEIWEVSLLLANADKPLPGDTLNLLKQPLPTDAQSGAALSQ
jgi:thiosulfate dehydrogenase